MPFTPIKIKVPTPKAGLSDVQIVSDRPFFQSLLAWSD